MMNLSCSSQRPDEVEPEMSDAERVSSELEGTSRTITVITAAFCFVVSEATVSDELNVS